MMLLPVYVYAKLRVAAIVSRHRDGEMIAQIMRMLRGVTIRGSTDRGKNRGGGVAVRKMLRYGRANHLSIAPDGPLGPRRKIQLGCIYLASRSGMPLVPVGLAVENPWRVDSWDKMAFPRPFSRAYCLFGAPIEIPGELDRDDLKHYRTLVQKAMDDIQNRAEQLAGGLLSEKGQSLITVQQALKS